MTIKATSTSSDRELEIRRTFNAPQSLVFETFTQPQHIEKWWGPEGFTTRVDQFDFRVGGGWRYVMTGPDGTEYPAKGAFLEIDPPHRYVASDAFDDDYQTKVDMMTVTTEFKAIDDNTTELIIRVVHKSAEERIEHEKMGVVEGWESSFGELDRYLANTANQPLPLNLPLTIEPQGSHEILITRDFHTTPDRLFSAFTNQEQVQSWMTTPQFPMIHCEIDCTEGGSFRYVWGSADGAEMGMNGRFVEISKPHRTVHTEIFDEDWTGGETIVTTVFTAVEQITRLTMTIKYQSTEARDAVLASPMAEGMEINFVHLDATLQKLRV